MKWLIIVVMAVPALVYASENCGTQFKGTCKTSCMSYESAAEGAFVDCADKEDCCVAKPQTSPKSQAQATAEQSVVVIQGSSFNPGVLKVKAGTEVVWRNKDSAPHTVTADDGSFDSGSMVEGGEFRKTFTKPGTISYSCDVHAYMSGKIEVTP